MLNQTCLHFGASKILLANLSGAKFSKKPSLTQKRTKKSNFIVMFKVKLDWPIWVVWKGDMHQTIGFSQLDHIFQIRWVCYSNVLFFFLRRVCPCSPRLWVLLTFCSKRWRFLRTLLWPSQNATRSQTLITKIKDYKTSTTQTSTTPQNQTSTTLCEK